jgi:FkbM family methyltransferase
MGSGEVFVDCGGFDGDTTEQLTRRCPQYKRVWLFEPSEVNMQMAKKRLAGARDIHFVPKGVSDQMGRLSFNSGAGSASAVSDSGDDSIDVTTIDKEVEEPVSFIKMDLEGWELKALAGARRHIEQDHPRLAVAVYHHASDFWMIPEFILSIRSDYDVFLRHYTEGWSETVMYFVPKSGRK